MDIRGIVSGEGREITKEIRFNDEGDVIGKRVAGVVEGMFDNGCRIRIGHIGASKSCADPLRGVVFFPAPQDRSHKRDWQPGKWKRSMRLFERDASEAPRLAEESSRVADKSETEEDNQLLKIASEALLGLSHEKERE